MSALSTNTHGPDAPDNNVLLQPTPLLSLCNSSDELSPDPQGGDDDDDDGGSSYCGSASSASTSDVGEMASSSSSDNSAASDIIANDLENTEDLDSIFGAKKATNMRPVVEISSPSSPHPPPPPPPTELTTAHLLAETNTIAPSARKGRVRGTSFSRVHLNAAKLNRLSNSPLSNGDETLLPPTRGGIVSPTHSVVAITSPCSTSTPQGGGDNSSGEPSHHPDLGAADTDEGRIAVSSPINSAATPDVNIPLTLSKQASMREKPQKVGFRVRASSNARRRKLMTEEEAVHLEVYEEHKQLNRSNEEHSPHIGMQRAGRPSALELPSPTVTGFTGLYHGSPTGKSSDGSLSVIVTPVTATPPTTSIDNVHSTPPFLGVNMASDPVSTSASPLALRSLADRLEEEELMGIFIQVDEEDEAGSPSPAAPVRRARGVSIKGRARGASVAARKPPDLDASKVRATSSKMGSSSHKHRHVLMVRTILERSRMAYFTGCRPSVDTRQQCLTLIRSVNRAAVKTPDTMSSRTKSKSSLKLLRARVEDEAHSPSPAKAPREGSPSPGRQEEKLVEWFSCKIDGVFLDQEGDEEPLVTQMAFPNGAATITPTMRCQLHKPSLDFRYCHMFQIPFRIMQCPFPEPKGDAYSALLEEHILTSAGQLLMLLLRDATSLYGTSAMELATEELADVLLERVVSSRMAIATKLLPTQAGPLSINASFAKGADASGEQGGPPLLSPLSLTFRTPSFTNILVELHLDHNHLTSLPEDIGAMVHLRRLVAKHNRLATLPPSLCMCDELEYLDLSNNLLSSLPAELGDLDSLEELVLDYNRFEYIPDCVFNGMPRLRKLFIIENSSLRNVENKNQLLAPSWLEIRLQDWERVQQQRRDAARKLVAAHAEEILMFIQDLVAPSLSDTFDPPTSPAEINPTDNVTTLIPHKLLIALLQRPLVEPLFEIELDNTPEIVSSYTELCFALEEGGYEQPARLLLQNAAAELAQDRLPTSTNCPALAESMGSITRFGSPTTDAASDFLFHHENQQHLKITSALVKVSWNKVWPDEVVEGLLALGSLRTVQNPTALHELGITHVLTCGRNLDTPRDFQRIVLADQSVPISETFEFAATGALVCDEEQGAAVKTGRGIRQLVLEVDDNEVQSLDKYFLHAIQFVEGAKKAGGKVVCHCFAGVSRSATVVVAYVMYTMGLSSTEALKFVQKGRAAANPNPNFRRQLAKFESACAAHRQESDTQKPDVV